MRIGTGEPNEASGTVFLDDDEVRIRCRPGRGADTCILLCVGGEGFECMFFNHAAGTSLTGEKLKDRWERGETVAKRWGCDELRALQASLEGEKPIICQNRNNQAAIDKILQARNEEMGEILYQLGVLCCDTCVDAGNPDPIDAMFKRIHGREFHLHRVCYQKPCEVKV